MSEKLIKQDLVKEIESLSAVDFENVCYEIFKRKFPESTILHKGSNINEKPVKGTIDINDRQFEICLECSTQMDYFKDSNYSKISNDIQHIQKLSNGKAKTVYLFCNHIEPPTFNSKWTKSDIYKSYQNLTIELYDAIKIAEIIFDYSIIRGQMFDCFSRFLPDFKNNMDKATYFENIPEQYSNFIISKKIYDTFQKKVKKSKITILSGISGAGKTELLIYYTLQNKKNFENVFWLHGEDYLKNSSLENFRRGDITINLYSLFNKTKTLIIIDNCNKILCENDFSILEPGFNNGGKILISSCFYANNPIYYQMPKYPEEDALEILGDNSEEALEILNIINLPVILTSIRSICEEGSNYHEIYEDLKHNLSRIKDNENRDILRRILNKYTQKDILVKLCNILNSKFDCFLLKKYLGVINYNNIEKSSFLQKFHVGNSCTIHNFIIECLKDNDSSETYLVFLTDYLKSTEGIIDEYILRQLHISYNEIKKIVLSKPEQLNWITYLLLQRESEEKKKDIYRSLYKEHFQSSFTLEQLRCLLDVKEAYIYDNDEHEELLQKYEHDLVHALSIYDNPILKKHLYHHLGKTQRRLKKYSEALIEFKNEIQIDNYSYAAYGQIVKCARKGKLSKNEFEPAINIIKNGFRTRDIKLPTRIALSLIADLRSFDGYVEDQDAEVFKNYIVQSSYNGMYQVFESFVAFISYYSYKLSNICKNLFYESPLFQYVTLDDINRRNYANACDGFTSLYNLLEDEEDKNRIQSLLLEIAKLLKRSDNPFEIRAAFKVYNKFKKFDEISNYNSIDIIRNEPWPLYWIAKAKLSFQDRSCIDIINLAIENIKTVDKKYYSAFFQCQAHSYLLNNNLIKAKESFTKAINSCDKEDFKKSLEKEINNII